MKSVIKYRIDEIIERLHYDGKSTQKEAKMSVVYSHDPNDPNYNYGQLSSGSTQSLKTINPDVYNTWKVGAIVECEMTVTAAE
jgi:hypothetical protein